ncbi:MULTISPECIES: efflux RND transporter permease subunit [Spirosoma]|uniref:CusA/CzcA family heavy metal efflux RND transporter n=1 Tax=Spirosoma liriopis TaxID=2937440 RepID=A0ABT0HLF2_9BACT|nr:MULTISPECIES: CusA/CzcA family heavy metal efflux RND transporter [Spirosoma]MCK8493006.1 CusA/CzcA family heavy metal efflux RND transporter [Spirosoma liriopis]UHG92405.1 CusA/CzcA family heavy metal efflux RND transporter [Spirosoma oryzicola]
MNKFIKGILSFSLKNKFFIFFLTVLAVVVGVISYQNTPIEAFPDVTNTQITLITQWPGRSAEEVEKFVTIPVEIGLNAVQKRTDIRSTSLFGLSVVKILFEDGVDDAFARQQVNNLLNGVELPEGVKPDVQPPYGPTGEIFRYTLQSSTRTARELKTLQDWVIERQLKSVPGVADVVSFGGEVKTYEISVDPRRLTDYNITPLQLYQAVANSNVNVGGDVIEKNSEAYVVRGIGLLKNQQDIQDIVIKNANGTPIMVRNVAQVSEAALPRLGQAGRDKQDDVVECIVVMRKGENPSAVIERVKNKINELNNSILPSDVQINTFYNRETLINFSTHTVTHNLIEGIVFVTVIVFLFMADWRTTVTVSIVIPLALLFAFICLRLKGMSANLLSMGAIDFGIIVDGAVVMVEGIFVTLDELAHERGMTKFNKLAKLGVLRKTGTEMGKAIFFSKLIIITCLVPIFSFQKVEGKMFSPLAWTLGFALLGALIFTLTLVPVLASILLKKNVREKHNPFVNVVTKYSTKAFGFTFAHKRMSLLVTFVIVAIGLSGFTLLGTEFLPELNEGSIYVRATMPMSISLPESVKQTVQMRRIFEDFPEVKGVISQTGRPNDGTDPTGFYNIEFLVDIYPQDEWKSGLTKEELVDKMQERFRVFPGVNFNFSQPIMDNVEEAVSGVKGSIAVKIYGPDQNILEEKGAEIQKQLATVQGIEDLGLIRTTGQPEMRVELDERKLAVYGVNKADAEAVIEMAIGGKAATQIYEGERKFDLRIRYDLPFRSNEQQISRLMVPTENGSMIPIKEIAKVYTQTGPVLIFREAGQRYGAVKFSVRGRDMGSAVAEAQQKVASNVKLPAGYTVKWAGDFENQQRATLRLEQVVPISLLGIFFILFVLFGNVKDAGLVLFNVPFAIIGGIAALLITHVNFSISAGIGFIALFGICIQNGVILISVFKKNLHNKMTLNDSIHQGVVSRIRPVVMTAMMAGIGLIPAAISHGIGSETAKPLAIVVIGGLITATLLTLFIFPLIFYAFYRHKFASL